MKKLSIFVIIICLLGIGACTTTRVAPNAVKLGIEYDWKPENKCSTLSPKIQVSGVPATTKKLRVSLTDLDKLDYDHGGGTVEYKGSNIIEAGALKYYKGPCPPSGSHTYSIKVKAIDASGVIVGSGEMKKPCCR